LIILAAGRATPQWSRYDYQQRALEARTGQAIRHVLGFVDTWEDDRDRIRKQVLYPLSYGAGGAKDTLPAAASPAAL